MGANALLDVEIRSDGNSVEGALAIVARRNRLGGESPATLMRSFKPCAGAYDLARVRVHQEPRDSWRILKAVLAGVVGFFLVLFFAFVLLSLAML